MKVKFYGVRGSVPTPGLEFAQYGGNTLCVLVTFSNNRMCILDAGTGIRVLGNEMTGWRREEITNLCLLMTHTHLDHIEGFRFFKPGYDPGVKLSIVTCGMGREEGELRNALEEHMSPHFHPVPLSQMGADIVIEQTPAASWDIADGITVDAMEIPHPVKTFSYRFHDNGKTLVYCTDIEHGDSVNARVIEFARGADLLIHDAQYTPEELLTRKGWGHSSWEQAIEVGERAGVKKLALFHHDPDHDDSMLGGIEAQCRDRFPAAFMAREGMEIEL
ncbi:MAG: MBL fold metallo-hydrolase [Dehalococcoidia bacterium]